MKNQIEVGSKIKVATLWEYGDEDVVVEIDHAAHAIESGYIYKTAERHKDIDGHVGVWQHRDNVEMAAN